MGSPIADIIIDRKKLRQARGLREAESTARTLGISRQHLWLLENTDTKPGGNILARMCELYGVGVADLTKSNGKKKTV